jgi:hypothetical protein
MSMKTLEQILDEKPPFSPSKIGNDESVHWLFLLEDGRLIEQSGCSHAELLGITSAEGDPQANERTFCELNKALRITFEEFAELDGRPGDYRCVYIEIFSPLPNEAQWAALGELYRIRGRDETIAKWDVYSSEKKEWTHGQGSLNDLLRQICPLRSPVPRAHKKTQTKDGA